MEGRWRWGMVSFAPNAGGVAGRGCCDTVPSPALGIAGVWYIAIRLGVVSVGFL